VTRTRFTFLDKTRLSVFVKHVLVPFDTKEVGVVGSPHLLVEKDGSVVTLTLNRPEARNAFGAEMLVRLADAWDLVDGDDDVRAVILTGSGGHFCAGADLKAMAGGFGADEWTARLAADRELHWKALLRSHRLRKPLIAAVEGTAVAGGTEILQTTDVRIAGESARFGLTEGRWGLFPLGGSTVRLRRQIPYTAAMDLLLTGRTVLAPEAQRLGLIGRVVPDGQALAEARRVAAQIAENGPLAVQAMKRSVQETEGLPEREALARELEIGWPILATDDAREGPRAFLEKRKPDFKGR
jgi:enoyl-CoA hydratase